LADGQVILSSFDRLPEGNGALGSGACFFLFLLFFHALRALALYHFRSALLGLWLFGPAHDLIRDAIRFLLIHVSGLVDLQFRLYRSVLKDEFTGSSIDGCPAALQQALHSPIPYGAL
jgi:hypothetical protein